MDAIIYIVVGFFIGAAAVALRLFAVERKNAELNARIGAQDIAQEQMTNHFKVTAEEAMRSAQENFLRLAEENFKKHKTEAGSDLEKRQKAVSDLVDPIGKALKEMESKIEKLGHAGAGLETQLKKFVDDMRLSREETVKLRKVLSNPAQRGKWGEMQLQRTLELIGMVEGTHYIQQISATSDGIRRQPDFVIKSPGEMEVVIDVKTPIEPYWEALEKADTEIGQKEAIESFKKKVRDHLKKLSSKEYWRQFNSPEFIVMFLPTEGLYSMAISNDPALMEEAAKNNVVLASPTTVMGLLRVFMHGWQQQKIAEEAQQVSSLASELYNRIAKFGELMQKLGRGLTTAIGAYNESVGSLESSVLPGARKFKDLHIQTGGREIPELAPVEKSIRPLSSPELLESAEKEKKKLTG